MCLLHSCFFRLELKFFTFEIIQEINDFRYQDIFLIFLIS